jgi:hypothetical protein
MEAYSHSYLERKNALTKIDPEIAFIIINLKTWLAHAMMATSLLSDQKK